MGQTINKVCDWLVNIANDNSHGYSQDANRRWLNPDVDCSSFIILAWENQGFPVKSKYGATYTGNMRQAFVKAGFKAIPYKKGMQLIKGDILLNETHHVVTYLGNNTVVHASSSENGGKYGTKGDQTGKEVCTRSFYDPSYGWQYVLRYEEQGEGNPYPMPTSLISFGSTGDGVRWIQYELNEAGASLQIDGDFGKATKQALLDFQKVVGIEADAVCGAITRQKLIENKSKVIGVEPAKPKNPYNHQQITLKKGSQNESVKWLQWELNQRGNYGLVIDGIFGNATAKALADWQSKNGLVADSVCGKLTRAKLEQ